MDYPPFLDSNMPEEERRTLALPPDAPPLIAAVFVVLIAAIILNPVAAGRPLTGSENRSYVLIVMVAAVAATAWRVWSHGLVSGGAVRGAASMMLLVPAIGLFLIDRVSVFPLLLAVVLTGLVVALAEPSRATVAPKPPDRSWLAPVLAVWLAVASIASLDLSGPAALTLIATASGLAAIWLIWPTGSYALRFVLMSTAGLIGGQIAIGTYFLKLSAFAEATVWIAGISAVAITILIVQRSASQ